MLTAALGWAMPSTAALFTAEDGSIALVLEQDAYPLEVRLTQDRAARLDHHFTAASPHAAPTQVAGGLAFLARKSQASGAPSGEVFFCVADTQGRDCRPGPFSANSPLVRDSVPGQVVGWHGPPGERTVISFDPSTRRTVPLSTPLPAVDLAMASGRLAVLTEATASASRQIHLFSGGASMGVPTPCGWCQAVVAMHRYDDWVLALGTTGLSGGVQGGLPTLPGTGQARLKAAVLSTQRGVMGPAVEVTVGGAAPPRGITPHWRAFPLDEAGKAWRVCLLPLGCHDLLFEPMSLTPVGKGVFPGRLTAPLPGGQWLTLHGTGGDAVLEWTDAVGAPLGSTALPRDTTPGTGDAAFCARHGCQPWVLEELPLVVAPWREGATWFAPGHGVALHTGDDTLTLYDKGVARNRWTLPPPAAAPLVLSTTVVVATGKALAALPRDGGEPRWQRNSPTTLGGTLLAALPQGPGEHALVGTGHRLYLLDTSNMVMKEQATLTDKGRWITATENGLWGHTGKALVFYPARADTKAHAHTWPMTLDPACRLHTDTVGAVTLCGSALESFPLSGSRRMVRLPEHRPPVMAWALSAQHIYLLHAPAAGQETWTLKVIHRPTLTPGTDHSVADLPRKTVPHMGIAHLGDGQCALLPEAGRCYTPSGETLATHVPSLPPGTEQLFSRLGQPQPVTSTTAGDPDPEQWQRTFAFDRAPPWRWIATAALVRGYTPKMPVWLPLTP